MEESFYHRGHKGSTSLLLLLIVLLLPECAVVRKTSTEAPKPPPYQEIQELVEAGEPSRALELYRDYLRTNPDQRVDRLLLTRLLLAAGHPEEARGELVLLIEESGTSVEALLTLAYMENLTGNTERQRGALEQALEIDPSDPTVLAALGTVHLEAEQFGEASAVFRRALENNSLEPAALRGLGLVLLNQEDFPGAVETLDRAIEADPGNPLNYSDRARARAALGNREAAVRDLSRAIELEPGFYWNYMDRGRHYLQLPKLLEAESDFSRAIEIDPEIFLPYVYRAGVYDRLDRRPEAIDDYQNVLELNPEYIFAYAPLGILQYLEENWQAAAEAFQRAYLNEKGTPSYALLAALSWMQLGKEEKAREYLNEQIVDFPRDAWPTSIARYYLNPALEARTVEAARREQNKLKRAQMLFYIASRVLLEERVETALRYLLLVTEIEKQDLAEKTIAEELLRRLGYRD